MKHSYSIGLACVLTAALAVGCSSSAKSENVGEASAPIINGSLDTDVHDSVVLLARVVGGQIGGICTGTLVAANLVLTARHCVSETDEGALCKVNGTSYSGGAVEGDHPASSILVYTGKDVYGRLRKPNAPQAAARGSKLITETTNTLCDRDVAFIILDRDVDAPIAPIRLTEGGREGEKITAVGWGLTENGNTPDNRMIRKDVEVLAVGPAVADQQTQIGLGKSEFIVGEAFCSGDSGGPAFASTGALVGVVSRGGNGEQSTSSDRAAGCIGDQTQNTYTHLGQKSALVQKAFAEAGATVRDEGAPPGKQVGGTCKQHVDCASNACISGKCTARCDSAGKCGKGQSCVEKNKKKVCIDDEPEGESSSSSSSSSGSSGEEESTGTEEEAPVANAAPTTTTTTTGCSASPASSSNSSSVLGGLGLAFAVAAAARRRRR